MNVVRLAIDGAYRQVGREINPEIGGVHMFVHKRADIDVNLVPALRDGVHRIGRLNLQQRMSLKKMNWNRLL